MVHLLGTRLACSLVRFSYPISFQMTFTWRALFQNEIAKVQLRQFFVTIYIIEMENHNQLYAHIYLLSVQFPWISKNSLFLIRVDFIINRKRVPFRGFRGKSDLSSNSFGSRFYSSIWKETTFCPRLIIRCITPNSNKRHPSTFLKIISNEVLNCDWKLRDHKRLFRLMLIFVFDCEDILAFLFISRRKTLSLKTVWAVEGQFQIYTGLYRYESTEKKLIWKTNKRES